MANRALVYALLAMMYAASEVAAETAVRVWAVDDGVRIDPQTGRAFEDAEIYPEHLRIKPGYRDNNCVYSAAKKQVGIAGARNEALAFQIQLKLEVFSFTLPDENHLGISLNDYGSISPGRMAKEKLWAFYQICHRHRCVLDVLYNAPKASGTGDSLQLDWGEYDAAFGPLFDGSAFTAGHGYRGPGEGVPVSRFYLPFESSGGHAWPRPATEMETEALALRTWGWIPWKYRDNVTTMCEWGTFYHGEGKRWRDPSLAAALGGKQVLNGDALLIYPGEFLGLDGPVPCIRLKALRRASQDYEYLRLLAEKMGHPRAVDDIVDGVLFRAMHEALKPGQDYWQPRERDSRSHDPQEWDNARRKLAELLKKT